MHEKKPEPTITRRCPSCGERLVIRWSRRRPFLGCAGFHEHGCRHTEPLPTDLALRHNPEAQQMELFGDING